jgi:hypothetical protein
MDLQNLQFHLFDISPISLNLFSFMLGATWAFFQQGLFGKRLGLYIFGYYASLAAWYALQYYILLEKTGGLK